MAASILKGLSFPTLVAWAVVGGESRNCVVSDVAEKDGGLAFTRLDGALPFFPAEASPILKWAPILQGLNEYGLTVPGLKAGRYEIRVGGKKVAETSAEDLAQGVSLAAAVLVDGPIAEQAKAVKAAVEAKNKFH
jgi:hypothetical protein